MTKVQSQPPGGGAVTGVPGQTWFDAYSIRAHWAPVLTLGGPAVFSLAVAVPALHGLKGLFIGVLTVCLAPVLGGFAQDMGKRREAGLWKSWGGGPTTRLLRHRDETIDQHTKARYFKFLASEAAITRPTPMEEAADPKSADAVYESVGTWLRRYVRTISPNPLAQEKNAAYGFARNLFGLRPLGLSLSALMAGLICFMLVSEISRDGENIGPLAIAVAVNLVMSGLWAFWVASDRVRTAADAYAKALLESCDAMPLGRSVGVDPSGPQISAVGKEADDIASLANGKA